MRLGDVRPCLEEVQVLAAGGRPQLSAARRLAAPSMEEGAGEIEARRQKVGVDAQGSAEVRFRRLVPPVGEPRLAEVHVTFGEVGRDLHGVLEPPACLVDAAAAPLDDARAVQGLRDVFVELERVRERDLRSLEVLLREVAIALPHLLGRARVHPR